MRILLINVCIRYNTKDRYIPVGLSCIATALDRAGFRPDILDIDLYRYTDREVDERLADIGSYDIVGMGNIVSGYRFTKALAAKVKQFLPRTILAVGNTVATSVPELLLTHVPQVDIAVIGEGDITIVEIARAVAEKKSWKGIRGIAYRDGDAVVRTAPRAAIADIESIPFPDYSLFEIEKYLSSSNALVPEPLPPVPFESLKVIPVNTARGCPFSCTFCNHAFRDYKYRYYSFDTVIGHVKRLQERYGINYVYFWDELTIFNAARLRELCDAIEKHGARFYWTVNPRPDTFKRKDLALLKRGRELGAMSIGGALESADAGILQAMNKRIDLKNYIEQVEVARQAGLHVGTSLVFGYPQETVDTIRKTADLCRQLGIYPSAGFLLPLPGTEIYGYAVRKGLIPDEEEYLLRIGDRQDLHLNLTSMPDDLFVGTVKDELVKLKNALNVSIGDEKVMKTGCYKVAGGGKA